ncbi:PEP_CTERM-anchored TLD domain-containing protein [Duganella violaceipulchra]|nr:PEP_CTERM-anchored TLD domain-containing protein [Duganella violaceicalia]
MSATLALALALPGAAGAAGAGLLTNADQAQLASWLDRPDLKLSLLFSKSSGDTATQFHAAVDNKGPTFSIMEASNSSGQTWVIGGYNPYNWNSSGTPTMTVPQYHRIGLLFNLTSGKIYNQIPRYDIPDDFGAVLAFNDPSSGPIFGAGADLAVDYNLNTGSSSMVSYCSNSCNSAWTSLLDNSADTSITYGRIEVYKIAAVPEPQLWQLLVAGLALVGVARMRAGRRA